MKLKLLITTCLIALVTFNSCKKDEEEETPIVTTATLLPCDYFQTNRTLVDDTNKAVDYIIDCVMDVSANVNIQPGVVIQFRDNAGLIISSGAFKSIGTAAKPVILTGEITIAGSWKGIYFQNSSLQNELIYTKINYAGGNAFDSNGDRGAILFFENGFTTIDHCEIFKSGHHGVNSAYIGSRFEITNTIFTDGAQSPINILPENMGMIDYSNRFTGHTDNFIGVASGVAISEDITISKTRIPFRFYRNSIITDWLSIEDGTTTINDSVTIQFEDGLGLYVAPNGHLKALGINGAPVLLTATSTTPGSWKGVYFDQSQFDNRIEYTRIEYSGNLYDNRRFGVLMFNNPKITIINSTLANINGCGIVDYNDVSSPNPNFTQNNNSFLNNSNNDFCFN
jgi:hypothetical protein